MFGLIARLHDLFHGRKLIPGLEDAEPDSLVHLLDELQVRRDSGVVEMELDHMSYL